LAAIRDVRLAAESLSALFTFFMWRWSYRYCEWSVVKVVSVMVATDRITAAAEIDPSYLPGGATVYPHVKHGA